MRVTAHAVTPRVDVALTKVVSHPPVDPPVEARATTRHVHDHETSMIPPRLVAPAAVATAQTKAATHATIALALGPINPLPLAVVQE